MTIGTDNVVENITTRKTEILCSDRVYVEKRIEKEGEGPMALPDSGAADVGYVSRTERLVLAPDEMYHWYLGSRLAYMYDLVEGRPTPGTAQKMISPLRLAQGMPMAEAVVDAGAVRFRPMLLTAAAVVAGASVILFDPIFQGLALSLMAGQIASLLLSRMTVPILYYLSRRGEFESAPHPKAELAESV